MIDALTLAATILFQPPTQGHVRLSHSLLKAGEVRTTLLSSSADCELYHSKDKKNLDEGNGEGNHRPLCAV